MLNFFIVTSSYQVNHNDVVRSTIVNSKTRTSQDSIKTESEEDKGLVKVKS